MPKDTGGLKYADGKPLTSVGNADSEALAKVVAGLAQHGFLVSHNPLMGKTAFDDPSIGGTSQDTKQQKIQKILDATQRQAAKEQAEKEFIEQKGKMREFVQSIDLHMGTKYWRQQAEHDLKAARISNECVPPKEFKMPDRGRIWDGSLYMKMLDQMNIMTPADASKDDENACTAEKDASKCGLTNATQNKCKLDANEKRRIPHMTAQRNVPEAKQECHAIAPRWGKIELAKKGDAEEKVVGDEAAGWSATASEKNCGKRVEGYPDCEAFQFCRRIHPGVLGTASGTEMPTLSEQTYSALVAMMRTVQMRQQTTLKRFIDNKGQVVKLDWKAAMQSSTSMETIIKKYVKLRQINNE